MNIIKKKLQKTWVLPVYLKAKKIKNKIMGKFNKFFTLRVLFPYVYNKYAKLPVQEDKVVFIEIRVAEITNSFKLLYDELVGNYDLTVHSHFLRSTFVNKKLYAKRCCDMLKDIATAKYVFLNEASNVISCIKMRPETVVTQTWHGCGAFKKFGMSTADLIFGDNRKELLKYPFYKNLTNVTISSPEVAWAYEEAMNLGATPEVIKPIGQSRTDIFYDKDFIAKAHEKLQMIMPSSKGKKVILYAPTFKGRVANAQSPNMLNMEMFQKELGDEYVVVVKHHPLVRKPPVVPNEFYDFAANLTNCMSIEELLCVSDICISDYSSLVFEYSIFEKPMIFFAYDLDEYCDWRGFYYNYDELTPGPVCSTNIEMIDYIKNIETSFDKQRVIDFRNKFMSACDGNSTKRTLEITFGDALEKYKREVPVPAEYHLIPKSNPTFRAKEANYEKLKTLKTQSIKSYQQFSVGNVEKGKVVFLNSTGKLDFVYENLQNKLSDIDTVKVVNLFSVNSVYNEAVVKEIATAEYIVLSRAFEVINALDIRQETTVIQLWNTVFPMANFGYCTDNVVGGLNKERLAISPIHKNYNLVPVASEKFKPIFEKSFGIKNPDVVQAIGCPTTDLFFSEDVKQTVQEKLYTLFPEAEGKKIIVYMPQCRHTKRLPDRKILLLNQYLHEYLKDDYVILCHHNPKTKKDMPLISKYYGKFMKNMTGKLTVYQLLSLADIVIGDYRPQVFEFASTGKPIFIYAPDKDIYFAEHKCNFDYKDVMPGVEVTDTFDLVQKIRDIGHYDYTNVEKVRQNYFAGCDGNATQRIVDIITK